MLFSMPRSQMDETDGHWASQYQLALSSCGFQFSYFRVLDGYVSVYLDWSRLCWRRERDTSIVFNLISEPPSIWSQK